MGPHIKQRIRNIATLGGANVAGLAISLLTVPILSRLYAPADYGAYAVVATIGSLAAPLCSLAYQDAIVIAPTIAAALNIVVLCLSFAGLLSLAAAAVLGTVAVPLASWLQFSEPPSLLMLAAMSILLSGAIGPLSGLANREQRYRLIATSRLASVLVTTATSVVLSYLHWGAVGLIAAGIAGAAVTLLVLVTGLWSQLSSLRSVVSVSQMRQQARIHANFPKYTLPTNFINSVTDNLPRTLLAMMFGETVLGLFTRASSLLTIPTQIVGAPISEIFRRDLSTLANERADALPHFRKTALLLVAVAGAGLVMTLATAPWLFPFLLGPKWAGSGEFAQLLAPMFAMRLVNSPLSFVVYLAREHRFDLVMTIVLLVVSVAAMAVAFSASHSYIVVVATYSVVCSLTSAFMLHKNFQFAAHLGLVTNEIQPEHA